MSFHSKVFVALLLVFSQITTASLCAFRGARFSAKRVSTPLSPLVRSGAFSRTPMLGPVIRHAPRRHFFESDHNDPLAFRAMRGLCGGIVGSAVGGLALGSNGAIIGSLSGMGKEGFIIGCSGGLVSGGLIGAGFAGGAPGVITYVCLLGALAGSVEITGSGNQQRPLL